MFYANETANVCKDLLKKIRNSLFLNCLDSPPGNWYGEYQLKTSCCLTFFSDKTYVEIFN